jgi:hypothetical protein
MREGIDHIQINGLVIAHPHHDPAFLCSQCMRQGVQRQLPARQLSNRQPVTGRKRQNLSNPSITPVVDTPLCL